MKGLDLARIVVLPFLVSALTRSISDDCLPSPNASRTIHLVLSILAE